MMFGQVVKSAPPPLTYKGWGLKSQIELYFFYFISEMAKG